MPTASLRASASCLEVCPDDHKPSRNEDWPCPSGEREQGRTEDQLTFDTPPAHETIASARKEGFCPEYFARLARIEPRHFWFLARNRVICGMLRRYFPSAGNFLEIGCGTGFVLEAIAGACPHLELTGAEYFIEGLEVANRRLGSKARLCQMDARHIPYEAAFDVVAAFDVLEHIPEDERVLQQMHQATRPGGGILLTVPQHRFLWSRFDEASCHQRRYTRAELLEKVRRAGFEVVRATSFVSFLFPLLLLKRLGVAGRGGGDLFDEFRLSGWMNAALEKVLALERLCLFAGASFPFGGSLLVAARKPR